MNACKTGAGAGSCTGAKTEPDRGRSNHEWTEDRAGRRKYYICVLCAEAPHRQTVAAHGLKSSVYASHHTDAARSTARLLCTVWRHTASEQRLPVSSYRRSTQHGASPMHGNYLHLHLHLCGRCPLGFGVMSDLYIFIIFFSVCCHTTGTPPGAAGAAPGPRGT